MRMMWGSNERGEQGLSDEPTIKGIGPGEGEIWREQKRKTPKIDRGVEGDPGHQLGRLGAQNDAFLALFQTPT